MAGEELKKSEESSDKPEAVASPEPVLEPKLIENDASSAAAAE